MRTKKSILAGERTQHTPGPWINNGGQIEAGGGHRIVVATVGRVNEQSITDTANARLIAAAPELLETCKAAIPAMRHSNCDTLAEDRILAAIAKAEGK